MFFEIDIDPKERAIGRFIGSVRKALMRAAFSEKVSQQSIAKKLGVNRSVINRILKGEANLTLRSVAEIAWALGWEIDFALRKPSKASVPKNVQVETHHGVFHEPTTPLSDEELSALLGNPNMTMLICRTDNDNFAPVEVAA